MYITKYAPWENHPKKLFYHEMVDPFSVLVDFFAVDFPNGHRSKLKRWRHFVRKDEAYKDELHGAGVTGNVQRPDGLPDRRVSPLYQRLVHARSGGGLDLHRRRGPNLSP